jgi:hypothetical protein
MSYEVEEENAEIPNPKSKIQNRKALTSCAPSA